MTPIETTIMVQEDGRTAYFDLPSPLPPGRHMATVLVDTPTPVFDVNVWLSTVLGSVTDDIEVPSELP